MTTQSSTPVRPVLRRRWLAAPLAAAAMGGAVLFGSVPAAAAVSLTTSCSDDGTVVVTFAVTHDWDEPGARIVKLAMGTQGLSASQVVDIGLGGSGSVSVDLGVVSTPGGYAGAYVDYTVGDQDYEMPYGPEDCAEPTPTTTTTTTTSTAPGEVRGGRTDTPPSAPAAQPVAGRAGFTG